MGRLRGSDKAWVGGSGATIAVAILLALPAAQRVFSQTDRPAPPSARAAEAPAGEKKAEGEKREEKPVQMNADLLSYSQPVYTLTGNVHFRQEDADLYCDRAEYDEDKDTARATGHLKMTTRETTVTGDLIVADFGQKVADITGNVRLEAQRKKKEPEPAAGAEAKPAEGATPPPAEEKKGETAEQKPGRFDEYREKLTVITCEHIQYWYEEERAIATGNVVAVQEDKTVTADEAVYIRNDNEETLTLTGNPAKLVMKNGNHMETPKVMIDLRTEVLKTGGPATGVFKREKKEETAGEKTEQPAPGPKPEIPSPPPATPKPQ